MGRPGGFPPSRCFGSAWTSLSCPPAGEGAWERGDLGLPRAASASAAPWSVSFLLHCNEKSHSSSAELRTGLQAIVWKIWGFVSRWETAPGLPDRGLLVEKSSCLWQGGGLCWGCVHHGTLPPPPAAQKENHRGLNFKNSLNGLRSHSLCHFEFSRGHWLWTKLWRA